MEAFAGTGMEALPTPWMEACESCAMEASLPVSRCPGLGGLCHEWTALDSDPSQGRFP